MKKKQSKKNIKNKKKNNYSESTAFANLDKTPNIVNTQKRSSSGIPKYVADRTVSYTHLTLPTILLV